MEWYRHGRILRLRIKLAATGLILILVWFLFPPLASWYLVDVDARGQDSVFVLESWDGSLGSFLSATTVVPREAPLFPVLYQRYAADSLMRESIERNAVAAGFSNVSVIAVPMVEPKTLNAARAAVESLSRRGVVSFCLVTPYFHTARSGNAYRRFARAQAISVHVAGISYDFITPENWQQSSAGYAIVFGEFVKKLYYDLTVW